MIGLIAPSSVIVRAQQFFHMDLKVSAGVGFLPLTSSSSPHVLCVDTGRSSETAKAHRG
eukprot:TRINITY_DN17463_c0_g1_i1.p2 TRINITY_DN17463_c0_g1~~TRINITY_DN17463_c0_g1_i1.p2  ORF type:complete len:59 (+),score=12.25 TRINITY_DN17463_c0_g1_i1:281-457(+)